MLLLFGRAHGTQLVAWCNGQSTIGTQWKICDRRTSMKHIQTNQTIIQIRKHNKILRDSTSVPSCTGEEIVYSTFLF